MSMSCENLLYEMPYCAACGRLQTEDMPRWRARVRSLRLYRLHPNLVLTDRRAVLPFCREHYQLGLSINLWLKKHRDGAYYDRKYLVSELGALPEPAEPRWLREEFREARRRYGPKPGPSVYQLEHYGVSVEILERVAYYTGTETIADLLETDPDDIRMIPHLGVNSFRLLTDALDKFSAGIVPASMHSTAPPKVSSAVAVTPEYLVVCKSS